MLMHAGLVNACRPKPNGKKPQAGMKIKALNDFIRGEMKNQLSSMQIYLSQKYGRRQKYLITRKARAITDVTRCLAICGNGPARSLLHTPDLNQDSPSTMTSGSQIRKYCVAAHSERRNYRPATHTATSSRRMSVG